MIAVCNIKKYIDVEHIVGHKNIDAYQLSILYRTYRLMLTFDIKEY